MEGTDTCKIATPLAEAIEQGGGLVCAKVAARMLGVHDQNMRRYRDRLTPIPVAGTADVYSSTEVWELAKTLGAERRARA